VDASGDRHSRHEPERQPSFEFGFFGIGSAVFQPVIALRGVGQFLARKKQYSEKHTSIHECENKNFARKRLPFRKRLRVLSAGRFSAGESGLVEHSQLALVT
jgi:hypothetical protein